MQNRKRIVGAAGRRFEPVTGIPEQEMEIMGEALPTLKKGLGAAAYMAAAIAPGTGEYIAYKDYKHFSVKTIFHKYKGHQLGRKYKAY